MSSYVPKHARRRRGLLKAPALPALVILVALAAVIAIVALSVRNPQGAEADPAGFTFGGTVLATTTAPLSSSPPTSSSPATASVASTSSSTTAPPSTTTTFYVHPIPDPVRIVIPAINVDAEIVPVGLLENGDMEVPSFGLAGWYKLGPLPGVNGPAVIVAHVDTKKGPDVFYGLRDLQPGDEIVVYGREGDMARFVVDTTEQQLKTQLPVERIWNDTWEPVIRLITCAGEFDRSAGHYLSNIIVYGHLVR